MVSLIILSVYHQLSFNHYLFFWGLAVLVSLMLNRKQGLHHSSTGIAHAEIESRERVALHTINQHVELIKEKWKIDNER